MRGPVIEFDRIDPAVGINGQVSVATCAARCLDLHRASGFDAPGCGLTWADACDVLIIKVEDLAGHDRGLTYDRSCNHVECEGNSPWRHSWLCEDNQNKQNGPGAQRSRLKNGTLDVRMSLCGAATKR